MDDESMKIIILKGRSINVCIKNKIVWPFIQICVFFKSKCKCFTMFNDKLFFTIVNGHNSKWYSLGTFIILAQM